MKRVGRVVALFCWAFGVWVLLTWTLTAEQLLFGAGIAAAVAVALAPAGNVAGPWCLVLPPRRLAATARLMGYAAGHIVQANLSLARRIWTPRLPLSSGMVITPTRERTDGGLAAVGLITSVIVDNQLVDLDPAQHLLQYHAVAVPPGGPDEARRAINGPVESLLAEFEGDGDRDART